MTFGAILTDVHNNEKIYYNLANFQYIDTLRDAQIDKAKSNRCLTVTRFCRTQNWNNLNEATIIEYKSTIHQIVVPNRVFQQTFDLSN